MRSRIYALNKSIKRGISHVENTLGIQLEPHILIVFSLIVIVLIQTLIFCALSSQSESCQLPNLRSYHKCNAPDTYQKLPTIYAITPTYSRYVQEAELTRLSHTFLLVPNLHWIIVEDSHRRTDSVKKFVERLKEFQSMGVTHLHEPTPEEFKLRRGEASWKKPKGIWQRNKALAWLRGNQDILDNDGIVYFADDDNTYDLRLFEEMRYTKKISVWPVAFAGGLLVERPLLNSTTDKVYAFNSMWKKDRPFPLDMAGFAIKLSIILNKPDAKFSEKEEIGFVESHFLNQFTSGWDELEPKADRCLKILVWHTRTLAPVLHEERKLSEPSISGMT